MYITITTSYKDYDVFDRYWFNFQFIQNLNIREGNVEITETDDKKSSFLRKIQHCRPYCTIMAKRDSLYDFLQP